MKIHRPRFATASFSETENVEVLNGALFMAQNVAERVSRLRSRTGRFPWSFSSLNLSRSYNQLATSGRRLKYFMRLVAIGFAYTGENLLRRSVEHRAAAL